MADKLHRRALNFSQKFKLINSVHVLEVGVWQIA
jgi:hypothetical protein